MKFRAVKDRLLGLDRDGFVELVVLEDHDMKASVTPKGREELAKYAVDIGTSVPQARKERQVRVVPKGLRSSSPALPRRLRRSIRPTVLTAPR